MQTRTLRGYEENIQAATGAPDEVLGILEEIMRGEIFHSTLDWQTRRQFNAAARKAWKRYQADPVFYDADLAARRSASRELRERLKLDESRKGGDAAAIAAAEAAWAEAYAAAERARNHLLSMC